MIFNKICEKVAVKVLGRYGMIIEHMIDGKKCGRYISLGEGHYSPGEIYIKNERGIIIGSFNPTFFRKAD